MGPMKKGGGGEAPRYATSRGGGLTVTTSGIPFIQYSPDTIEPIELAHFISSITIEDRVLESDLNNTMDTPLSAKQTAALFDILSHHNTYAEIRDFRFPGALDQYGPPFSHEAKIPSSSPALQSLVSKFALSLPGLKDVPEDLWKVQTLVSQFPMANCS